MMSAIEDVSYRGYLLKRMSAIEDVCDREWLL